ncbi:hypothetical protein D3C78_1419990 [compost metagenome]
MQNGARALPLIGVLRLWRTPLASSAAASDTPAGTCSGWSSKQICTVAMSTDKGRNNGSVGIVEFALLIEALQGERCQFGSG